MSDKRAAVLLAPGFEEVEAISVVDVLRRAGIEVTIASTDGVPAQTGAHDITVSVDAGLEELAVAPFDLVVLPGGMPGSLNLAESPLVRAFLRSADDAEKWLGAICAGPLALDSAGLLRGRRYTCYPGFQERIESGTWTGARTERDGRIVTGKGPGAALEFGLLLVQVLGLEARSRELAEAMLVVRGDA